MTGQPIICGDCRTALRDLPDQRVQCCVTSPPYWGLRSYLPKDHPDKAREIGSEATPEAFVETMVQVFREVKRCLHDSGTLWLNLGDSYSGGDRKSQIAQSIANGNAQGRPLDYSPSRNMGGHPTIKPKDLCMIPWRVALALQADGWWLRSVIVWHKRSCMPESVTDRPTNSWEPIFLLAKSQKYYYDAEAVKEQVAECSIERAKYSFDASKERNNTARGGAETFTASQLVPESGLRNQRNVWSLGPEPYSEAHFATFPTEIPKRAILAGTSAKGCCPKCFAPWQRVVESRRIMRHELPKDDPNYRPNRYTVKSGGVNDYDKGGGQAFSETQTLGWQPGCKCNAGEPIPCTVLDPFGGSGTTGQVAIELGRKAVLIELNSDYVNLVRERCNTTPGLMLS